MLNKFLEKDNKNNGLMTKVWGPPGWVFLHSISMGYPLTINEYNEEHLIKKHNMKIFFESVGNVFPCVYCRDSYKKFIIETPIDAFLNSRKSLAKWVYIIHNTVNNKLGVPKCDIPSFENMYIKYESFRAECTKTTSKDRIKNLGKGCVVPKDGFKKKCVIKIIKVGDNNYLKYIIIVLLLIILISFLGKKMQKI